MSYPFNVDPSTPTTYVLCQACGNGFMEWTTYVYGHSVGLVPRLLCIECDVASTEIIKLAKDPGRNLAQ